MHFKRLELIGFKSFADKTAIQFEPGVTAIVGPNGCGKSNIADSIRWVLGEQSAKSLRGASMEDVIFNGSAIKEALNLAEVSLTLSNEARLLPIDYDEVTITRRLYRSGESEYLINKNVMRLRDINEMLMGTGLGTDSYSIIEQGKMDLILNSKPEERRSIFEEAAGITKFKAKKKEALRKLEQTDSNLLRVNDIIQEVKRQIGSIERQAKKAEVYKVDFEKLKNLELAVASRELLMFSDKHRVQEEGLNTLRREEADCQARVGESETSCAEKRSRIHEIDEALSADLREEIDLAGQSRMHHDRIRLNHERAGELNARKEELSRQLEGAQKRIEELSLEFQGLDDQYQATIREESEGHAFLESVESEFNELDGLIRSFAETEAAARTRLFDLAGHRAHEQNEHTRVEAKLSTLAAQHKKIEERRAAVGREENSLRETLEASLSGLAAQEALLNRKIQERAEREAGLESSERSLKELEELISKLTGETSVLRSKFELLSDLKEKREGFSGGVKALLEEKERQGAAANGMIGVLADILRIERGFELAVEAGLENYAQAVIFEKTEDVLFALDHLRPLRRGRALLLSLEDTGSGELVEAAPEGSEPILSRVSVNDATRRLIEKLLGRIFFVNDPKTAFSLSRRHPGLVFVTKEGERFEGHAATGGSLSSEVDLLLVGRESRLADTKEMHQHSASELSRVQTQLEEWRTKLSSSRQELGSLSDEIPVIQVGLADDRAQSRHIEEREKKCAEELEVLSLEERQIMNDEAQLRETERTLAASLSRITEEDRQLNDAVRDAERSALDKVQAKETLLVRLAETRSLQNSLIARREKIEKDRGWVSESRANEEARVQSFRQEIDETGTRRDALDIENLSLEEALIAFSARKDELLRKTERQRGEREQVSLALAELEAEKAIRVEFLSTARDKAHAFELQSTQLRYEMDRLKDRIFNAYQVDLVVEAQIAEANAETIQLLMGGEDFDAETAKPEIQALKDKLAKMGPVNLVAIQEYDEMKERYDFLTKQQADLVQAKDDLHKAILKMNRQTREMFTETFEKIRKNFTEYFKMLFGGGSAELLLLDEQDVLESGIEIVTRPPGKKLQNISLLSGGEKALTAVALLFAIFKVRPSPFCILDEIDAPLDESNVDRFCNVLKEFIPSSQFILVTHNKRTMNLADALYGITMAETGVSRIVSVKFSENATSKPKDKEEVLV